MYVKCTTHIVNLILQEGLKDIDNAILKVRDIVR